MWFKLDLLAESFSLLILIIQLKRNLNEKFQNGQYCHIFKKV